jgi:hypothetical protein
MGYGIRVKAPQRPECRHIHHRGAAMMTAWQTSNIAHGCSVEHRDIRTQQDQLVDHIKSRRHRHCRTAGAERTSAHQTGPVALYTSDRITEATRIDTARMVNS